MTQSGGELRALTSLRFFAAAAIVLHHSQGSFGLPRGFANPLVLDQAVSLFYVLSGFILTHVHPSLERGQRVPFLWARLARVWPGHAAVVLLLLVVFGRQRATDEGVVLPSVLAANLLLLHSWLPYQRYFFSFNNPSWSVSNEAFFYLTFPLLIHRFERTWFFKLPLVLGVSLSMVWLADALALPPAETDGEMGAASLVYIHPLARWFEFGLGMCTALLYRRIASQARWSLALGTGVELGLTGLLAFAALETTFAADWLGSRLGLGRAGAIWLVHGPVVAPAVALLIMSLALARGLLSQLLSLRPLVWLGDISYSVYLLHFGLLRFFWVDLPEVARASGPWAMAGFWALLLLLSHLLWSRVERPARARLVKLLPMPRR